MNPVFLCGPLADEQLLRVVLGGETVPPVVAARFLNHELLLQDSGFWPALVPCKGVDTPGILLSGLETEHRGRLDFFLEVFAQVADTDTVITAAGTQDCVVYCPKNRTPDTQTGMAVPDTRVYEIAAAEIAASQGRFSVDTVAQRLPQILQRAASTDRANRDFYPGGIRRGYGRNDVEVSETRQPYVNYFAVREDDIRYRRFDGRQSELVTRAAFVAGDAAVILPYDAKRDRVMVIEQFRYGLFVRGDPTPWAIEPIAGRVDVGEDPEDTARREAQEEAGLDLSRLFSVAQYYSSSGAYSEYLYVYIGLADLPDESAGIAGLDVEAEDIRSHVLPFAKVQEMIANGEIRDGQLMLAMLWLEKQREAIRADT